MSAAGSPKSQVIGCNVGQLGSHPVSTFSIQFTSGAETSVGEPSASLGTVTKPGI